MKALIMSHENGGSYVMDRDGCFRFVKGYASRPVGSEVELSRQFPVQFNKIAAIAACLVVAFLLGGFGVLWNTESYSVYVDINPSVELVFNGFARLKAAKSLNEDGAALLDNLSLKGTPGDVVIDTIRAADQQGYIVPQENLPCVLITITAKSGKNPGKIRDMIIAALEVNSMASFASVDICDSDLRLRAEELGVSPGKLMLAERLCASDQSLSIIDILKMSIKDLVRAIQETEESQAATDIGNVPLPFSNSPGSGDVGANSNPQNAGLGSDDNDGVNGIDNLQSPDIGSVSADDLDDPQDPDAAGDPADDDNDGGSNNGGSNNSGDSDNSSGGNNDGGNSAGSNSGNSNNSGGGNSSDSNGGGNNSGSNNGGGNNGSGNNGGSNNGGGNNGGGNNGGGNNGGSNNGGGNRSSSNSGGNRNNSGGYNNGSYSSDNNYGNDNKNGGDNKDGDNNGNTNDDNNDNNTNNNGDNNSDKDGNTNGDNNNDNNGNNNDDKDDNNDDNGNNNDDKDGNNDNDNGDNDKDGDNDKISRSDLVIRAIATVESSVQDWWDIYQAEMTPFKVANSQNGISATVTNAGYQNDPSFVFSSSNKCQYSLLVPNSNQSCYAKLSWTDLYSGNEIPLALVNGNGIDQVGVATVRLVGYQLEISIDGYKSGDCGCIAFNGFLPNAGSSGNFSSLDFFDKKSGLVTDILDITSYQSLYPLIPNYSKDWTYAVVTSSVISPGYVFLYFEASALQIDYDYTYQEDTYDGVYAWETTVASKKIGEGEAPIVPSTQSLNAYITVYDSADNVVVPEFSLIGSGSTPGEITLKDLAVGTYTVMWYFEGYAGDVFSGSVTVEDGKTAEFPVISASYSLPPVRNYIGIIDAEPIIHPEKTITKKFI